MRERRALPCSRLANAVARIVIGACAATAASGRAGAQAPDDGPASDGPLEEVFVTGRQGDQYRRDASALTKLTENLLDTPQTVATLSNALMNDRAMTSLNDALRSVPGITLGAGEFSWQGNNPSIRGFSARDDMYLDGIRDFGSYPRDPFDYETVEVLMGPSSVLFGRGSTGGAINQVTKQPILAPLTAVNVNVANDATARATADIARPLASFGDGAAVRVNALAHAGEVADRDGAKTERYGLAPSLALGLGTATRLTLAYLKQTTDDRPDYGLPWLDGAPAPVARKNFYGFDSDYLKTDADVATVRVVHTVGNAASIDAAVRHARYARSSRITEPLITPVPPPGTALDDLEVFRNVFIGDSDETLLAGQINATVHLQTGGAEHAVVSGIEVSRETSRPVFAFGIGAPATSLLAPDSSQGFTAVTTDPRVVADTTGRTVALYALDTIKLGDLWQLTAGARWDRFDTSYAAMRFSGPPTPFNSGTDSGPEAYAQVDTALSYRAAVVYKPAESVSAYLAVGDSFNPSAQSLSMLTTGRGLGVGNVSLDPEENRSIEVGLKANVNDGALALATALFEITKTNARIPDPQRPGFNTLGGEQRVRGLSVDVNGRLAGRVYLTAGYAYLDGEIVRGAAGAEPGAPLANVPEHSLSLWLDYALTERFDVGFGARYVAEQVAQSSGADKQVPAYTLFDAMARYRVAESVTVKLNLSNLGDDVYYEQLHPWHVVPGAGFTATLAVNMSF